MTLDDYDCPNCKEEIGVLDLPDRDYEAFKCPHCSVTLWVQSDLNWEMDYYFYLSILNYREIDE